MIYLSGFKKNIQQRFCGSLLCIIASVSIIVAFDDWVPLTSQQPTPLRYDDLNLITNETGSEFTFTFNFPGVTVAFPDDDGLLAGKYPLLSIISEPHSLVDIHHVDAFTEMDKAGKPDLPFLRFLVRIPSWVHFDNVKIDIHTSEYQVLDGTYDIAPIQEHIPDSDEPCIDTRVFLRDETLYSKDEVFSYPLTYQKNTMHGIKFLEIYYSPLHYNPVSKKVFMTTSAQMIISFKGTRGSEENKSELFESIVSGMMFDARTGLVSSRFQTPAKGSFLVVTGSKFKESQALQRFIEYRKNQNYKFLELFQSDETSAITTKIKEVYKANKFDYLIIVGDETVVKPPTPGSGSGKFSFKDWSKLDGTDDIEDVMMGIFLCSDEATLTNVINHQILQEKGGPWSKTVLTTAGSVTGPNWGKYCTAHYSTVHLDDPSKNLGFRVNRVYQGSTVPTSYGSWEGISKTDIESWVPKDAFTTSGATATESVKKFWNEGVAVISHRDHGSASGPSGPKMNGAFVSGITSTSSPLFLSINCLSGSYVGNHSGNFAYQTQVREAGTCATLAASVSTITNVNCRYIMAMYDAFCPKKSQAVVRNIGKIYQIGMLKADATNRKHYHLFGDPMTNLSIGGGETGVITDAVLTMAPVFSVVTSSSVQLTVTIPTSDRIGVQIYTLQGKLVRTFVKELQNAGTHSIDLSPRKTNLTSGMYVARVKTSTRSKTINFFVNK